MYKLFWAKSMGSMVAEVLFEEIGVEYENVPIDPPSRGAEAIRKTLEQFAGTPTQIEFVVHQQTCTGSVVMNERTDRFEMGGKWAEIRVMGVFEVAGGKIKAWRDYFDLAQFTQQMTGQDG